MMKLKNILLAVVSVIALASCTKEEIYQYDWTEGLRQLMDKYFNGAALSISDPSDDGVTFRFEDGDDVFIGNSDIKLYNIAFRDVPSLASEGGFWTVNLVKTGIPVDKYLPDDEAYPVCIWFNEGTVNIFVSNGHTLVITCDANDVLSYFAFKMADNVVLKKTIVCEIDGTNVVGARPLDLAGTKLAPTFTYRGKSIKVEGEDQVSGVTKQDFAHPVKYDIELYSGEIVSYTVSLETRMDFPTIFITTQNNANISSKDFYVKGNVRIEDPRGDFWDTKVFEGSMQIKGRGNATWTQFPKKPYRIKLDESASIFGLPKNKDWILLANYSDKTLLRNIVAMKVSEICGMPWTPQMFPVDVYLNGKYIGNYTFCDHKEVAKHRVDIELVTPDDNSGDAVTGGYYFEIEQQLDEPVSWSTTMGVPMMFKDPERPTQAQINYVKGYFNDMEAALSKENFNINTGYPKYIDIESWVNNYIVNEVTKNIDGNLRKSTFLTKERGQKLKMYHVWDFDFTLGNCDYFNSMYGLPNDHTGFFILKYGLQGRGWGWYYRLSHDPVFLQKVKNRWNQVYPQLRDVAEFIDEQQDFIRESAARNFERWDILHTYVWPNPVIPGSFDGEVAYMRSFYVKRIEWLNTEINKW